MSTQSILNNIYINDSKAAENFISALENAAESSNSYIVPNINSEDLSPDEIINHFGVSK